MVASTPANKTTAVKPAPTPQRSKWRSVPAFVSCQLVAILFVEFVLCLAGLGEEEIFKFDSTIGFRHMPSKRVTWRTEGFAQSNLDADGMREPGLTIAKPPDTYRVAVLGDSMVEGFQVPVEQTFGALAAKELSPIDGKQVQVLNFGTSGYSTAQEYLQLKRQVFKYKPDLVLLCYNSRDVFENWSPPDQVITNVRPAAVHLPGSYLFIDSSPVVRWLKTPRAKFLQATEWFRQNSRIYGLFSAVDLEMSQKNLWYRAFINAITSPKRAITEFKTAWSAQQQQGPAFQIKFFEDNTGKTKAAAPAATPAAPIATTVAAPSNATSPAATESQHVFNSAASNESLSKTPPLTAAQADQQHVFNSAASNDALKPSTVEVSKVALASPSKTPLSADPAAPNSMYRQLIQRTLNSLFTEMRKESAANGAGFAVMSLPVRSQLCPLIGMETSFGGIDYAQELDGVQQICATESIPYLNIEKAAETLPLQQRESLFYVVHLAPAGQEFIARAVTPFLRQQLTNK